MDIILEGKIDPQEGIRDLLETILQMKSVQNSLLRITSADKTTSGRVAFSQNRYILGASADDPHETGYKAVRQLLSIKDGTYAVLDVGRTHIPEVNQTLWIDSHQLIELLPDLPESPETIMEGQLKARPEIVKTGHISLRTKDFKTPAAPANLDTESKARTFDQAQWHLMILLIWAIVILSAITVVMQNWTWIRGIFSLH
jgi:hypothetical protein